ncbi:MAG TPA: carboxypeptidase-like regulatory domain-containing protein, partial [Pyrinomonadaceae bacterium]|nr:carboxypeptidase-like regulatory domain-containing protein [Pyrinomonadaceae bacterium]
MRKSLHLILSFTFALLLLSAAKVSAQTSGEITGLVTDSSGAAVTGATATVTNKATGAARKVVTNSEGLYSFPSLMPGVYELKVEQAGFKTARLDNITLEVQQTARLDVKMEVGQVGETVTVTSNSALLNAETATVGTVIENKIVTELPLNGRQYLNLVALSPNVNVLSPSAGQAL